MLKEEFLSKLREALIADRTNNVESLIDYYNEMICDRIEDGMDEEAAVEAMGPVEDIVRDVSWDKPISTLVKQKVTKSRDEAKSKGNMWLWVILLIFGSPVWLPLLATLFVLVFIIYLIPWIIIVTIFAVLVSLAVSSVAVLFSSFISLFTGGSLSSLMMGTGSALVLGVLTVLLVKPFIWLAKGTLKLGKQIIIGFKKLIMGGKK